MADTWLLGAVNHHRGDRTQESIHKPYSLREWALKYPPDMLIEELSQRFSVAIRQRVA